MGDSGWPTGENVVPDRPVQTLQAVAHLVHQIGIAARMLNYSMIFKPKFDDYRHELLPDFVNLIGDGPNLSKHMSNENLNSISALKEFINISPRQYRPSALGLSLESTHQIGHHFLTVGDSRELLKADAEKVTK